jgi:hypothetical protein
MARRQTPPPGRLIVSIIYSSIDALADALKMLERHFGRVQYETMETSYTSDTYSEEMGDSLERRFFSFEKPVERDRLPQIKATCLKIEKQFGDHVDDFTFRTVNLDPGILTPDNLIMASTREYNHRIYLADGVFADLVLVYAKGRFVRMPWTVPDFYQGEAIEFFLRVRESFELVGESAQSQAG